MDGRYQSDKAGVVCNQQKPEQQNDAPELAYSDSPIVAPTHYDGLQRAPSGRGFHPPRFPYGGASSYTDQSPLQQKTAEHAAHPSRRRWWPWIVGLVLALLIGLGVGLGVGYAAFRNAGQDSVTSSSSADSATQAPTTMSISSSPTPSATTTSTQTASSTASAAPVTSGTTGIAALSCNSTIGASYYNDGVTFGEDCYTEYPKNGPTWNATSDSDIVKTLDYTIAYTFQQCMDACVEYNNQQDGLLCAAVVYNANLTVAVPAYSGNCYLKNHRGAPYNGDTTLNYANYACGYVTDW